MTFELTNFSLRHALVRNSEKITTRRSGGGGLRFYKQYTLEMGFLSEYSTRVQSRVEKIVIYVRSRDFFTLTMRHVLSRLRKNACS